ncbi:MAG: glycosyltransferase [Lachnospiraceae bacterium]|nr:glycosyltransferase [Lachnospiraceae bacterium]
MKKVSIIIPVREINDYIREAIPHHLRLDYPDYEILIFPDEPSEETFPRTRIIPSGKTGPAEKRDMALEHARGEILAFIDDDAYPRPDWLKNAVTHFDDPSVGAVGGPAVTAENDGLLRQASGKVYESFLCSGGYTYRYIPGKLMDVEDLPSVNLIVRKDIFAQIGGYDSNFYPGEDTKLCLDIIKLADKRIVYDPDVLVYHHRRKLFREHLKQSNNYALHRGYFAKVLPDTSRKIVYFVPSLFVLGLVAGPLLALLCPPLWYLYFSVLLLYFLLLVASTVNLKNIPVWILSMAGVFLTHVGYGIGFVRGLLSRELIR